MTALHSMLLIANQRLDREAKMTVDMAGNFRRTVAELSDILGTNDGKRPGIAVSARDLTIYAGDGEYYFKIIYDLATNRAKPFAYLVEVRNGMGPIRSLALDSLDKAIDELFYDVMKYVKPDVRNAIVDRCVAVVPHSAKKE